MLRSVRTSLEAMLRQPLGLTGALLLVLFVLIAILAPHLTPYDSAQIHLATRLLPPNLAHPFGTDELGRDVLARTLFGTRVSLAVAVSVVSLSLVLGALLGAIAGYFGGFWDSAINLYLSNAFLALPGILLAVAFVAFLGPSIPHLIEALALSGWVAYARLVRALVMAAKEREYVQAARSLGATDLRILLRHIAPNILQPVVVQAAVGMAAAVLAEATLSFLGLGVQPPTATWGAMLNDARSHLFESPYLVFFPSIAVMLCVLAFNFLGDALRDALDPRS
jgi:peptide/nickel transport system permease protein